MVSSVCRCFEQESLAGCLTPRLLATLPAAVAVPARLCIAHLRFLVTRSAKHLWPCGGLPLPPVVNMSTCSSHPQIVSHVEAWDITPVQALLLLLKPSERAAWRQRQSAQQQR